MELDQYEAWWAKDSKIDKEKLSDESVRVQEISFKYRKALNEELKLVHELEGEQAKLYRDKKEFYTFGPTEETPKHWRLPPHGMFIKGRMYKDDVQTYLNADDDIIKMNIMVALQKEKTEYLVHVLESLKNRSYHIGNAIAFEKFMSGFD